MKTKTNATKQTRDLMEYLATLEKDPAERAAMSKAWKKATEREKKKGPAGEMTALFMSAVRF